MEIKTETHIATIFKIEELTVDWGTILVLIPYKVTTGNLNSGIFNSNGNLYQSVVKAYQNGEKFCFARELELAEIVKNGKEILTSQFLYESEELTTPAEILGAYKEAYTEELNENVWYVDLSELVPYVTNCSEADFYVVYNYSIDRKTKKLVNRKPTNVSDEDLQEVSKSFSTGQIEPNELREQVDSIVLPPDKKITRLSLISHLKKCILAQDVQVERIASAIYNPIKLGTSKLKRNIMIYGPTGSGKTAIVREIALELGLPFYKADLSEFSASGYTGSSVESIYTGLYLAAGRDIKKLEQGAILFLDEVDKLIISDRTDIKRQVYNELLTLLDPGGVVNFKTSQMGNNIAYDKRNLIIITAGSFGELDRKMQKNAKVGFGVQAEKTAEKIRRYSIKDFTNFGIPLEFLGRQQLIIPLNELSEEDLFEILSKAFYSPYVVYKRELETVGIALNIPESTLKLIASKAYKLHTGARSLSAIFDEALEPEINAIVDQLDEGNIGSVTIEVAEEEMVKRLERYHGN